MTDMIERVARALVTCEAWSSFWSDDDAGILARAAIAAMREPTEAMVAFVTPSRAIGEITAAGTWVGMVDAALAEIPAKPPNEPA